MKIIQLSGEGMQTIQQVPEVGICQKLLFPPIGEDTRERGWNLKFFYFRQDTAIKYA